MLLPHPLALILVMSYTLFLDSLLVEIFGVHLLLEGLLDLGHVPLAEHLRVFDQLLAQGRRLVPIDQSLPVLVRLR